MHPTSNFLLKKHHPWLPGLKGAIYLLTIRLCHMKNTTLLWENIAVFTGAFAALLFAMTGKPPGQSFCPFLSAIVFNFAHFSSLICSLQKITYTLYILHVCDFVMLHVSIFSKIQLVVYYQSCVLIG